jgi:hypothetical protein
MRLGQAANSTNLCNERVHSGAATNGVSAAAAYITMLLRTARAHHDGTALVRGSTSRDFDSSVSMLA